MKRVYFDNAATTPMRDEVVARMLQVMKENYGNPSSTHAFGRSAKSLIEQARKTIAKGLKVAASEIVFTSGGTEADNLVLNSAVRDLGVQRIITSPIEHHAVLHTVEHLRDNLGVKVDYVPLDAHGLVDLNGLEKLLAASSEKTLVSLMHVNNEVGNLTDIRKVGQLCRTHNALFHSDTVQSVGLSLIHI